MEETANSQSLVNGLELPESPGKIAIRERTGLLGSLRKQAPALQEEHAGKLLPWLVEAAGQFRRGLGDAGQRQLLDFALDITTAIPDPVGQALTADLVTGLLSGDHTVEPAMVVDTLAGRNDAAAIITGILARGVATGAASPAFLASWQRLLLPLLGGDPTRLAGPGQYALRILEHLSTLEADAIPGELALMLGRLAIIAGPDAVAPLRETGTGRLIERLYPGILAGAVTGEDRPAPQDTPPSTEVITRTGPGPGATDTGTSTGAGKPEPEPDPHTRFLAAVEQEFRACMAGVDGEIRQLREDLTKVNNDARKLTAERDRLNTDIERERGLHREREARARDQIQQLQQELDDLRKQLKTLREERDRWQQETRLTEQGSASSLELRMNEYRDRIRGNLTRPLRDIQGMIERMLEQESTRKQARLVAANLDRIVAQMVRIGVFGEHEVKRIPRERFMQPGS